MAPQSFCVKRSRPMLLLCIMCDIRVGGLHRTMTRWPGFLNWATVANGALWCFMQHVVVLREHEEEGKTKTARLIVLTCSKRLHLTLWQRCCFPAVCVCVRVCACWFCLPARPPSEHLLAPLHRSPFVTFMFLFCLPFSLSARLSVSHVCLSVVKTFHRLRVTKRGLKC